MQPGFFHLLGQYFLRKPYGIHSPFLYSFSEHCLYKDVAEQDLQIIENHRRSLLKDKRQILFSDFGAGSRSFAGVRKNTQGQRPESVSRLAKRALQRPSLTRLLFRISRYLEPATILELGTSFGISAACLSKGKPHARVITIEGCPGVSEMAAEFFSNQGLSNIRLMNGTFANVLPDLLPDLAPIDLVYLDGDHQYDNLLAYFSLIEEHLSANAVLVIDDIRWSAGMRKAWNDLCRKEDITLAVDLGKMGLLFRNPDLSKQIIRIGF